MSETVLVLRALGLGDFLTAVPALRALEDAFPDRSRVIAAPRALAPLAGLAGGGWRVADAAPLAPLDRTLEGARLGVNLHGTGPESHRVLIAARPGSMIAFAHPEVPETAGAPRPRAGEHEVERWCRLLTESGVPADPARLGLRRPPETPFEAARGATVVHPGAASRARRWPPERFASLAASERAAGREVVVTGAPAERELALAVARRAGLGEEAVVAGRTDLLGLAAVVSAAGRVVSGDTGVSHLATAFGTPSVTLFGPLPPSEWGPPTGHKRHRSLWAGRRGDPHADRPDPGLLALGVDEVRAALAELPPDR